MNPYGRPRTPVEERVWLHVLRGEPDDCWCWTGKTDRKGYGRIGEGGRGGRELFVHRVAFIAAGGVVPEGLNVLHHCDNPPCCNPAHLYVGTKADNLRDMEARGQIRRLNGRFVSPAEEAA